MTGIDSAHETRFTNREWLEGNLESALEAITARQLMTPAPLMWPSSMSVAEFSAQELPRVSWSSFPTFDDRGEIDGLVVIDRGIDLTLLSVAGLVLRDIAIPRERVATARLETNAFELLSIPRTSCAGRILVLGWSSRPGVSDPLIGIITPTDLERGLRSMEIKLR